MAVPTQESYLVVGGGTSCGENIVEQLLRRGETRVTIFEAQPLATEQAQRFGPAVRTYVGDILDPESILDAVKSCAATCVIHSGMVSTTLALAARYPTGLKGLPSLADVKEKYPQQLEYHRKVNTDGTRNVLAAALGTTVTQLVYVGNADIVFDGRDRPMLREDEAQYPAKCLNAEVESQSHAERMVLSFNGLNELRTAVIRPSMLFGPSLGNTFILRRIQACPSLAGFQVGEKSNLVDRTHVANVAHAAILAADRLTPAHPQHVATAGRAFFITNDEPRPFWDFMREVWVATGGAPPPPHVAGKGTMMFIAGGKRCGRRFEGRLAREVLGYAPIVSYDEGVRRIAEWWLELQLKICKEKGSTTDGVVPPPWKYGMTNTFFSNDDERLRFILRVGGTGILYISPRERNRHDIICVSGDYTQKCQRRPI
ncbi:3Beta-HSD domain-containing protein [Mycena sanguinolenta]|uniref:3Beta-HSD domain-containing protein n=1 Tax=Mycena sanguinolenta TaxID=230812 RepID=A0A8H7CH14_9AGAR|nr:3Beta-HSD domain-containing protein [Mycena sanguinolenta]